MLKNKTNFSSDDLNSKKSESKSSQPLCASHDFIDACSSARKAWHRTNLLAISKPKIISRVKQSMIDDDAIALRDLLIDIMGPVAPITPKDAMGPSSVGHREMAGLICLSAMRMGCLVRKKGEMIDLDFIKNLLLSWIDFGEFRINTALKIDGLDKVVISAKEMGSIFSSLPHPDRVRLAVVAPLAPALESMIVISILSDSVVKIMSKTADHVAEIKIVADELVEKTNSSFDEVENNSSLDSGSSEDVPPSSTSNNPFNFMAKFLSPKFRNKKATEEV